MDFLRAIGKQQRSNTATQQRSNASVPDVALVATASLDM